MHSEGYGTWFAMCVCPSVTTFSATTTTQGDNKRVMPKASAQKFDVRELLCENQVKY
jgi:hypothetical protein